MAYDELDGEIITRYAAAFARVGQSLTEAQRTQLTAFRAQILGNLALPRGAYLYAEPIAMPAIPNTDFLFTAATADPTAVPTATSTATLTLTPTSTPVLTNTPTRLSPATPMVVH